MWAEVEPSFDALNDEFQAIKRHNNICMSRNQLKKNKLSEIRTDQKSFLSFWKILNLKFNRRQNIVLNEVTFEIRKPIQFSYFICKNIQKEDFGYLIFFNS